MRPLHLLRSHYTSTPDSEPVLRASLVPPPSGQSPIRLSCSGPAGLPDCHTVIPGLTGTVASGDDFALPDIIEVEPAWTTRTAGDPDHARDIIGDLHAQYWRALADEHVPTGGVWAEQPDGSPQYPVAHDTREAHQPDGEDGEPVSIEALLAGERALEDLFGKLDPAGISDFDLETAPEVLHLFAPPGYRAGAARRASALPPALTRREHHALSADSPMAAPLRKDNA